MHSVTYHEIIFSFTFGWSLSLMLSMALLRSGEKPARAQYWAAILAGPAYAMILLAAHFAGVWRQDRDGYAPGEEAPTLSPFQRRLGLALRRGVIPLAALGLVAAFGLKSPSLRPVLSGAHIVAAALLWLIYLLYVYLHVNRFTSRSLAALTSLLIAVLILPILPWKRIFMVVSILVFLSTEWAIRTWRVTRQPYVESLQRDSPPAGQAALLWALLIGLAFCAVTGVAILVHPGWTSAYFILVKSHSYVGYGVWLLFAVYLYRHVRQYADATTARLSVELFALLSLAIATTNEVPTALVLLNIPLFALVFWAAKRIGERVSWPAGGKMHRAGVGLLIVAAFTFASGAYIAEPFNTLINNNIGLYVLYIHGEAPLLLLPWLVGLTASHVYPSMSTRNRLRIRRGLALAAPAYVVLLVAGSLFSYVKWFGLDAGQHFWPPPWVDRLFDGMRARRTTYVTYNDKPPCKAEGAYPPAFREIFDDYRVCSQLNCHGGLVHEWKSSTHRFAASNLFFRKVIERMQAEYGADTVNYFCLNCHAPSLVLHPDRVKGISAESLAASDGVNCKACHLMCGGTRTKGPRDGLYEIRPEMAYAVRPGDPQWTKRWEMFIRWDLRLHFRNYSIPNEVRSGEGCGACHVSTMPTFITGLDKDMTVTDLVKSWKESDYYKQGETCVTCHMPYRSRDERIFLYPDHRIPGLNVGVTLMVDGGKEERNGAMQLDEFTRRLVKGELGSWPDTLPFLDLTVVAPDRARPGETLPVTVRTTNSKVGHYFHAGPSSLNEVWLEVKATTPDGGVLFHSGALSERDRMVDPDAHRLGATIIGKDGQPIHDCSIWRVSRVEGARRIKPLQTIEDAYAIPLPADVRGPVTISATWNHRRASQAFVDWVYGGKGPAFPVVPIAAAAKTIQLE